MLLFGFSLAVTIVLQVFIIISKTYIENKKHIFFSLNALILIFAIIQYAITDYKTQMDKRFIINIFILIILNVFSIIEYMYQRKRSFNKSLIKKTIDDSECGILAIKNGKIMFQNSIMYNLLKDINIHNNYIENIKLKSNELIGNDYVIDINNKIWLFCINEYQEEITAFDISEEYKLQKELEEQNKIINQNNTKILYTINNIEKIEKEEKTLKIKNKFHDVLGQRLSILQMYLNQEIKDDDKFEEIKFMTRKMFTELEDSNEPDTNLKNLIKINDNIGININLIGTLPEDKKKAKIFFEIIREAVTNATRHADSTQINIKIEDGLLMSTMTITNNGKKPKEVIYENEGIKGMRRRIKKINGKIFIYTEPEFIIKVQA